MNYSKQQTKQFKILQIGKYYPPFMGGIETHLQNLSESLCDNFNVEVVVANHEKGTKCDKINSVIVKRLNSILEFAGVSFTIGLFKVLKDSDANLIHIHLPHPFAIITYLLSRKNSQLVVTYHSDIIRQRLLKIFFYPVLKSFLKKTDIIIVTSPNLLEHSKVLTEYRNKCRIIPYGISTELFSVSDQEVIQEIRNKYGPRIILGVGRLIYYKGFDYLVDAMSYIDGQLILIGEGPLRKKLENIVKEKRLCSKVHFLGSIDNKEIIPYINAADIFVLPSIAESEAFGIVQLEAMACGKPVLSTDLKSGVPWVNQHEKTGLVVPPKNVGAIVDAVNLLLMNDDLRNLYGMNGKKRVEEVFTLESMTDKILKLYKTII